ncbi:DMT family transporter [Patescibacteria group bacterium]|nr:DMT family transporter [Patescibacteria group bacterium]MBU2259938.1 DMT family transporter [Patescibacteria group bacterium]
MWFAYALISAVLYSSMWLFARASRGLPSGVVTALFSIWSPFLLFYVAKQVDFPWQEQWWQLYLVLAFIIMPITLRMMTYACQRAPVTVVNPLASLSTFSTLAIASVFFAKSFSSIHIVGMVTITLGLFFLYHGQWIEWRKPWPWLVLGGVMILGLNVAVLKEVLERFPHPIALMAFAGVGNFAVNSVLAGKSWFSFTWTSSIVLLLAAFALADVSQNVFTFLALSVGPAPHVVAVKRTSILFAAIGGYFIFKEKDQSLVRLIISCVIVAIGVALLNV